MTIPTVFKISDNDARVKIQNVQVFFSTTKNVSLLIFSFNRLDI